MKRLIHLLLLTLFALAKPAKAQCIQIETILVDACGGDEGFNEMVRFKVGGAPLNVSNLTVNWPNNPWLGLIQNSTTNALVNALNADIQAVGGCGQLVQPVGGVLPANATVFLVTSHLMDPPLNQFGPITETYYILFQNNSVNTGGHFANYAASGLRTLQISFGSCTDSVTYDRANLTLPDGTPGAGNGAIVNFTPAGVASYTNLGCLAPVPPFTVEAGADDSACAGNSINLLGNAQGFVSVMWSAPSGTFSNPTSLSTSYTLDPTATVPVTLTLTATNVCGAQITDTLTITPTPPTVPTFSIPTTFCSGATVPALPATSDNGIAGTWNPSAISNTASASYVFTPSVSCASSFTLNVTVNSAAAPTFSIPTAFCAGSTVPALPTTSDNGIAGTWSPSVISNSASASYVFTPSTACASNFTLNVTISSGAVTAFSIPSTICSGATPPVLPATSDNGIPGTWNPAVVSNTASGTYVFTPSVACAPVFTINVTVTPAAAPVFSLPTTFCAGATVPVLPATSDNGIAGTWNPSAISNTASGSYVFTPSVCGSTFTLNVTINNPAVPAFSIPTTFCAGSTIPALPATSNNGISGTWNPSAISNTTSGSYVFTPSAACASIFTLNVTITNPVTPTFSIPTAFCSGSAVPALPTTSNNGVTGTWSPSAISNTNSAAYVFTPSVACAPAFTLNVTITPSVVPVFAIPTTFCAGSAVPVLPLTSDNGIAGTWSPASISNTASGTYVFTPSVACAQPFTLTVAIESTNVTAFSIPTTFCAGSSVPALPTTSDNGVQGTWSPSAISNTTSGTYVFTPNSPCAPVFTLNVTITTSVTAEFSLPHVICSGAPVFALPATSDNGIQGTWNPPAISNTTSGNYVFTPNATGCLLPYTLTVTVAPNPQFALTDGTICVDASGNSLNNFVIDTGMALGGFTFSWTRDNLPISTTGPSHTANQTGTYVVTVTNNATGCQTSAQSIVTATSGIVVSTDFPGDFQGDNTATVVASGGSGQFAYSIDGGGEQYFGTFVTTPGEHVITIRDMQGCGTETVSFYYLDYPVYFTPNGDGFHDWWNIDGLDNQDAIIYIFDRYGKLLKAIKPSSFSGWDGTYNGRPMPSTDYWFTLDYTDRSGSRRQFKSHFALKR